MKNYLLFFVCICKVAYLSSQALNYPFPQPGMQQVEVNHGNYYINFAISNASFCYQQDTIINSWTYSQFGSCSNFNSNHFYTFYFYGQIYYMNNGNFSNPFSGQLLYDFSLGVGQTFTITQFCHYGTYTVDSVSYIVLANNQTRKYMELTDGSQRLKWLEGVGDIEHGFFYQCDWEGGYVEFVCNSDSSGSVYSRPNSAFNCDPFNPMMWNNSSQQCNGFSYQVNVNPETCSNSHNGSISISGITGGTSPYSLQWNTGDTTAIVSGLGHGTYSVIITDSLGVSCSHSIYVTYIPISTQITQVSFDCDGGIDGCISVYGGTPPFSYLWSNGSTLSCQSNLSQGTYSCTVTDANGCASNNYLSAVNYVALSVTDSIVNPTCSTCCDGSIMLTSQNGRSPYTFSSIDGIWPTAGNFCPGMYHYCITDNAGCSVCDSIYLSVPLAIEDHSGASIVENSDGSFTIINTCANAGPVEVQLFNVAGQMIWQKGVSGDLIRIGDMHPEAGVYVYRIMSECQKQSTGKLVVF